MVGRTERADLSRRELASWRQNRAMYVICLVGSVCPTYFTPYEETVGHRAHTRINDESSILSMQVPGVSVLKKEGQWSYDEDERLLEAVSGKRAADFRTASGNVRWSSIQRYVITHRSKQQIRCRYQRIHSGGGGEESGISPPTFPAAASSTSSTSPASPTSPTCASTPSEPSEASLSMSATSYDSNRGGRYIDGEWKATRRNRCRTCGRDRKGHVCRPVERDRG